jgi:hypothetical protein
VKFEFLTIDLDDCPADKEPAFFGFECPKRTDGFMCSGLVIRGNKGGLSQTEYDSAVARKSTWEWNGNREAPTFSPSIDCKRCSHGYIENGKWRNA